MPLHVSSIKLVKYRDKYTEMHDQQNVKKILHVSAVYVGHHQVVEITY